jgi:hypothetical protein
MYSAKPVTGINYEMFNIYKSPLQKEGSHRAIDVVRMAWNCR